ncbi:Cytidine deaminase-like [Phaffia rhodozyma]|uniref:Cytidine deaminase-like n=1 Tax=Phaffia rhodozyma TaxID=264483 RepID=A0A0F7SNW0_PHARH|nr:Cytidine deaminase-like [Phaffia rhodozyma]
MTRTDRIHSLLLAEAQNSDLNHKHAAAIVKGGKIISMGHNQRRTYFGGEVQHSMHAEMSCILTAPTGNASSGRSGMMSHSAPFRQSPPLTRSTSPDSPKSSRHAQPDGGMSAGGGEIDGTADDLEEGPSFSCRRTKADGGKSTYGADIYVCRVTKSGALAESRPCYRCFGWIVEAGIKRVFFTMVDEVSGKVRWECQTVTEMYDQMLNGQIFATASTFLLLSHRLAGNRTTILAY